MGSQGGWCGRVQSGQACGLDMSGRPHRIRVDRLRSLPRVVPYVQRSPAVSRTAQGVRWNALEGDGGGTRPCRRRDPTAPGVWTPHGSPAGSPRVAGSKGHAPKRDGVRGVVGAGAGAAVVLARVPLSGQRGARRAREGESWGARARRCDRHGLGPTRGGHRWRGGAYAGAMGGGGLDGRSWARTHVGTAVGGETRSRRSRGRCSLLCVHVRKATRHGEAMVAQAVRWASWRSGAREGPKAQPRLQGYGALVLGCTPARGHRGPHGRARDANAPARRDG
jgi:hypothetical protein